MCDTLHFQPFSPQGMLTLFSHPPLTLLSPSSHPPLTHLSPSPHPHLTLLSPSSHPHLALLLPTWCALWHPVPPAPAPPMSCRSWVGQTVVMPAAMQRTRRSRSSETRLTSAPISRNHSRQLRMPSSPREAVLLRNRRVTWCLSLGRGGRGHVVLEPEEGGGRGHMVLEPGERVLLLWCLSLGSGGKGSHMVLEPGVGGGEG